MIGTRRTMLHREPLRAWDGSVQRQPSPWRAEGQTIATPGWDARTTGAIEQGSPHLEQVEISPKGHDVEVEIRIVRAGGYGPPGPFIGQLRNPAAVVGLLRDGCTILH